MPIGERVVRPVVPQLDGPIQGQLQDGARLVGGERLEGPAEDGGGGRMGTSQPGGEAIEEEFDGGGWLISRSGTGGPSRVHEGVGGSVAAGVEESPEGQEVRPSGPGRVQGFEGAGCRRQERRRVTAPASRHRQRAPQQSERALVGRVPAGLRLGQCDQVSARVEGAGGHVGLRGVEVAADPAAGVGTQVTGPPQEGTRRGQAAPSPGAVGRCLQFRGHLLVRAGHGCGAVPGPAVRVHGGVGGFGQGVVRPAALPGRRTGVHGRAQQGMPKDDPGPEIHEALRLRRADRLEGDPERIGRLPDQ